MYALRCVTFLTMKCDLCEKETRLHELTVDDAAAAHLPNIVRTTDFKNPPDWVVLLDSSRNRDYTKHKDKHVCPECAAKVRT